MKIEICPVCGSPIEYMELTTLPPVPVKQCPSCGCRWEGKTRKIEYAPIEEETTMMIEDLEKALQYFVIAVPESEEQAKAYFWARKAIIGLRSMPEAGEPLSLEQLREMNGKPVWIVEYPDWGHWELSEDAEDYLCDRDTELYGLIYPDPDGKVGLHKLGWLAYAYPPVHIDRSKWECCLWCKDLQYLPYEMCADVKMPGGSEIGASFCPSCGRPLTEEAWAELEKRMGVRA